MSIPCPAPGSGHDPIAEADTPVGTLLNVVKHLAEKDSVYLEARCYQLLADLGIERPSAESSDPVSTGTE